MTKKRKVSKKIILKNNENELETVITGNDLLKMMNEIPEEWIETCYEVAEKENVKENNVKDTTRMIRFSKSAIKWIVTAMIAIFLCGGGITYAAMLGMLQFTKNEDKTNPGYSLTVETERITVEELTGDIQEVKGFLIEYMAKENYKQTYPSWLKRYETVEEARAYIGYENMKATKVPGTIEEVNIRVIGDTEGNLGEVSLFVRASEGKISITEISSVFTEQSPITLHGTGIEYTEELGWKREYGSEEYITSSGKTAMLVYDKEMEGLHLLIGAVVDGAMYYELSVMYYPEDFERAKEILLQWCEQF